MKNIFSKSNLEQLRKLIGQKHLFVAGPTLWEYLSSDLIFIVCGEQQLLLQGDTFEDSFEGFKADYSQIKFGYPDSTDLDNSLQNGYSYYLHAGEVVTGVSILRETIRYSGDDDLSWEYVTDCGFILELTNGSIVISKLGHHDEMLQVTYMDVTSIANIPETVGHFEADLNHHYSVIREQITVLGV